MKKNNKGFTLIEMLAAVVILGILSAITITGVVKYITSSKDKAFKTMSQSIYQAVENCASDFKGYCLLPTSTIGDFQTFTTDNLIQWGYLKDLKNPNKNKADCTGTIKTVLIKKTSTGNNSYAHSVRLNCEGMNKDTTIWPNNTSNNFENTNNYIVNSNDLYLESDSNNNIYYTYTKYNLTWNVEIKKLTDNNLPNVECGIYNGVSYVSGSDICSINLKYSYGEHHFYNVEIKSSNRVAGIIIIKLLENKNLNYKEYYYNTNTVIRNR